MQIFSLDQAATKAWGKHIQAQRREGMLTLGSGGGARSSCRFAGQWAFDIVVEDQYAGVLPGKKGAAAFRGYGTCLFCLLFS
jgi:hypothetical protein